MANVFDAITASLESAGSVSKTVNTYLTNEAKLSTQNKQIQLKADINAKMDEIRSSNKPEEWETKINQFFEQTKSSMMNPDSPYYCKNNLQGQMFTSILDEAKVDVDNKVSGLVWEANREKAIIDYRNNLTLLSQTESGQGYIDKANGLAKSLFDCGYITREQYQTQLDTNFNTAYIDTATKAFDGTVEEAIKRGDSKESLIKMALDNVTNLMGIDTDGLPKTFDKEAMNKTLKKNFEQNYRAYLADYQQGNANKLSEINQQMRQASTAEGKLAIARRGQQSLSKMTGNMLSEDDRNKYAAYFDLGLNGSGTSSGSGSGSGSKKPDETFANFCKAQPGEALQMVIDNDSLCPYDAAQIVSDTMVKEWFTGNFKENYDLDSQGRLEDYKNIYEHSTSVQTVTDAMLDKLIEKYPTAANYLKNNCSKLISDIQKNPKEYGEASAGELADFMRDWILSAPAKATDDDFVNALKGYVNNCYIERCKYIELKDNGKLRDTFNAKKPADIAKAAQLASEKDFVFTDQYGNERWAKGKKEALEAPGGVVNVLQNAVVGTLGIPESEYKDLSFYYQRDESGHDMTNKPIITYKDKAYEVIANDDGKGFTVREYAVDENGKMQKVRDIEGKAGGKLQKVMRKEEKKEAAQDVKDASAGVATIKKDREQAINKAITESTSIPKAMKAVGTIEKEEWEDVKTVENRTTYLNITERKINNDASKVEKDKMSAAEFKNKYGIDYNEWIKTGERSAHYELILKS